MISIFNGTRRTLGKESKKDIHAQIDVDFRDYLHYFKGAKLAVFIAIALHADSEGLAFPSYDTLQKETGLGRDTIAKALTDLCDTKINGHTVLMKWRERNKKGQILSGNRYKIFPTEEEIQSWEKPTVVQTLLEEEPINKEEPIKKTTAVNDTPLPPKTPSPHQLIIQTYVEELGYTPPNGGVMGKAAKWLVQNGYTPDQVRNCYRYVKAQKFYQDKMLSLQVVQRELPEFVKRNQPPSPQHPQQLSMVERGGEMIRRIG